MRKIFKRKWYKFFFLDYRIFLRRNPLFEICPNCKTMATLERLKEPTKIRRLPRIFGLREFHCKKCKWEGYIYLFRRNYEMKKILKNYITALFFLIVLYFILLYFFDDLLMIIYNMLI